MPHITRDLIRKRSEHNEGIITTLEELSLHQEELESISEVLGMTCKKLKILYLQNNIISRMENLHHMKDLNYLNMALNNITIIEGLGSCEFLHKLDLTVNFIDFDTLEASINHLKSRHHLTDLYMIGNPAQQKWEDEGFFYYVVANLPQLKYLDGKEITRSTRIVAQRKLPELQRALIEKAEQCRREKAEEAEAAACSSEGGAAEKPTSREGGDDEELAKSGEGEGAAATEAEGDEMTPHNPETRVKMYLEVAEQKAEKEKRQKEMAPRERDYEKEQAQRVEEVRQREMESETVNRVRQCNEGKWDFSIDEEARPGYVVLDVGVQKHLDSSLIDVDIHPLWVSVVIKSKVLRLALPAEVKVSESKAQRSKTSGHLVLIMPKVNPEENMVSMRASQRERSKDKENCKKQGPGDAASGVTAVSAASRSRRKEAQASSLAEEMLKASLNNTSSSTSAAVDIRGIVKNRRDGGGPVGALAMMEVSSTSRHHGDDGDREEAPVSSEPVDDDDVPPLV